MTMAAEEPASVVKALDEMFAMQTIRKDDLPMVREAIVTQLCIAVEELIEACGDAGIINRADDLLSAFRWVNGLCVEYDK